MAGFSLSIILPVLNEATLIEAALQRLAAQAPGAERIVVDGGSNDRTIQLARNWAKVVSTGRGRALQMNTGAAHAHGDWLLFLHADTELPPGFAEEIARAEATGYQAGAFSLWIQGKHPLLPLLSLGANARTRFQGIAFGDQALFARRDFFLGRGGFPELPLMEDMAWTQALRRSGIPLYVSRTRVGTSGRRWDQGGFWTTWWRMRVNQWRFKRGRSAEDIAQNYQDPR